jgi:hypothetical protein
MPSRAELVNRANVVGLNPASYPNDSKLEQKVIYLETNASTMAGTLATGTLTTVGTFSDGETITIGSKVYTMKTALTGVKATGLITSDATAPDDGDTVTIEGKTYTFKTTLSSPAQMNEVLIGASAAAALDNLKIAINASGGTEGTEYSVGTTAHSLVTATTNTNTTQLVEARQFGTAANEYSLAETSAHLAWGDAKMGTVVTTEVAGVANVVDEVLIGADAATSLDNLKLAINNSATEGTQYSYGTKAHPEVTATTNADDSQIVQAIDMAVGEDLATTETAANASWGATTLASGVADQNAVDATAKAQTSGGKNVG